MEITGNHSLRQIGMVDSKVSVIPAGKNLCLEDLRASSISTFTSCSAASTISKVASVVVTSCSWCPCSPPLRGWNPALVFIPPGLLKQLVSSLESLDACVCVAERSSCSIVSSWLEFPAAAAGESRCLSLRSSRVSLRRLSSCISILLPAFSTAAPQVPPYWATNLTI